MDKHEITIKTLFDGGFWGLKCKICESVITFDPVGLSADKWREMHRILNDFKKYHEHSKDENLKLLSKAGR